ncbi:MAG: hypothetical protein QGH19_01760 [Candidatus Woesearchaeota archaeon]|jgi:predicted CopG family antitoxin|nr:hypothetical protein [Candidatus Woesearchaeota archaeon]MDP7610475.1 hypothetical protein [Candidatus Woesearchaeota archaeon]|tara:strand:- start:744 stop:977 length:234 start_codon:yes stop_codon:yes gene_type:complete
MKSIKISDENYRTLTKLAGSLQTEIGAPVSIDFAITYIQKKDRLSDLAGSLKMSDKEVEAFTEELKKGWKRWNIKSA